MAFPFFTLALGLSQFAPVLGKWLNSDKGGDIAQEVASIAAGITSAHDEREIIERLNRDPEILLEFQRIIFSKDQEWHQRILQDRESARNRDVEIRRIHRRNSRADIMVVSAALGLILCLGSLGYYAENLPGEAVGIISTIAGIFGACLKDAYAFEFGSSRGSKEKDSTVAAIINGLN